MADIEYSDGTSADIPGKLPGETVTEFYYRQAKEVDDEYNRLKKQVEDMGLGAMFDGSTIGGAW